MKIIIVGPAYPYRGGIADTNQSFALSLKELGHEVVIHTFTLQYPKVFFPGKSQYSTDQAPNGLTIKRSINSLNPYNWRKAAKAINQESADLVIFRYWTPFLAPALGKIAQIVSKKTKCYALCDNVVPHENNGFDRLFTSYFVKQFDGFVTFSEQVKKELQSFSSKKIIVHPHPINLDLGEVVEKSEAKKQIGLKTDTNYLLFFGLVRKYKGLDLMIESINSIKEFARKTNIKLLVAGEFYDKPEIYLNQINELKISDLVEVRNEFIPANDVKYYFSSADLVTQTYHTASQSGITQMALNFNKAVLVTDVGGLSEIIHHEKNGYVVSKDPSAIGNSIVNFYKERKAFEFENYSKNLKSKFSWKEFCLHLLNEV